VKLRIHGNSIRVRLTQADLDALLVEGAVEEGLNFADGRRLVYALRSTASAGGSAVYFDGESVEVLITGGDVLSLRAGRAVELAASGQGELQVLVEMDLPCRHGEG
jgi:hypothetical protein